MTNVKKPIVIEDAGYVRNIWHVKPDNNTKVEDILKPEYWAHLSKKLKAGDLIQLVPADRHYFVEVFVLASANNWAKVVPLRHEILVEDNDDSQVDGYVVQYAGGHQWRVKQGDEILTKGHEDKASASNWLINHMKEIG